MNSHHHPSTSTELRLLQGRLFDPADFPARRRNDPLEGWPLVDVRALAIDPDVDVRVAAAASRWNWDGRLQRVLATDPDKRVVMALLDHVDPCAEICELIIDGPHVRARRELAGRNLPTTLLLALSHDADADAAKAALKTLTHRRVVARPEMVSS